VLMDEAYVEIYTKVGLTHGRRVGASINTQLKNFTFDTFSSVFKRDLISWLIQNGSRRIVTVRQSYLEYINQIITTKLADGKSMSEIATELQKLVKSRGFYRWQALRIARTETTTAANYAAAQAGNTSGFVMEKMWISALDNRTRRPPNSHFDHYDMNQKRVGQREKFYVSGDNMAFPGSPEGQKGNVINCRCTVAIVPKRNSQGDLIRS
jgi:uncharacterized protein with gpF-like domain